MYSRTDSFKYSYFIRIINEWNSLPNDIKESVSISGFKHKVVSFLDTLNRFRVCAERQGWCQPARRRLVTIHDYGFSYSYEICSSNF